ncbi:streptococcal hemagglutinin-like protein [Novymonas esmeraldas]|uniref:Streptococcal hemagglutinin-like protein n=1 Tax=Novymonas esmeraldas TaxID=1808958 RepID=A0AAW0F2T9_9TRYP
MRVSAQRLSSNVASATAEEGVSKRSSDAAWRAPSRRVSSLSPIAVNSIPAGGRGADAISTGESIESDGSTPAALSKTTAGTGGYSRQGTVITAVLPISAAPGHGATHTSSLSSSTRVALTNQIVSDAAPPTLPARGGGVAHDRAATSLTSPRRVSDEAGANDVCRNALNSLVDVETPHRAVRSGGGESRAMVTSAAAATGARAHAAYFASSSTSSDGGERRGCATAMHHSGSGTGSAGAPTRERPPSQLPAHDTRGFLNPGYSCHSSDMNSDDGGGRAGGSSRGARGSNGSTGDAEVPLASGAAVHQPSLALFPLTAAEEQAVRLAYDAYAAAIQQIAPRHPRLASHRTERGSAPAAASALTSGTASAGREELLRLLHRLFDRAQAIKAPTAAPGVASATRLLSAAEVCFGTGRFQALMAAVSADDRTAAAAPLSSPPLTVEEALSYLSHLKYELAADVFTKGERRPAEHHASPGSVGVEGDVGEAAALPPPSPPKLAPPTPSPSPVLRLGVAAPAAPPPTRGANQAYSVPLTHTARGSSRPPPSPMALTPSKVVAAPSPPPPAPAKAGVLAETRKATGRRRGPRRSAARPPPSPHPSSNDSSGKPEAACKDDLIHTYVQRKAFAEIAEGQGLRDGATVTLERLTEVLRWFELALNPTAVERVCGVHMHPACGRQTTLIDFSAFAKIIDSGLFPHSCIEASCSSYARTSAASADNHDDPRSDVIVLVLPAEAAARSSAVVALSSGLTAAEAAAVDSSSGAAPCPHAASSTSSMRESEVSLRTSAAAAAALHRRLSTASSAATSATSVASGGSAHRLSADTDDAYPLVARDSAIAALCRGIRQRLRQELRRSVSSGPETLPPARESRSGCGSGTGDGEAEGHGEGELRPLAGTTAAYAAVGVPVPVPHPPAAAAGADRAPVRRGGRVPDSHAPPPCALDDRSGRASPISRPSVRAHGRRYSTRRVSPPLVGEPAPPPTEPPVEQALPPSSHPYAPTTAALYHRPPRRSVGCDDAAWPSRRRSVQEVLRQRRRGSRLSGAPPTSPMEPRRPACAMAVATGPHCQRLGSACLLASLSPYYTASHDGAAHGGHPRTHGALASMQGRLRRASSSSHAQSRPLLFYTLQVPGAGPEAAVPELYPTDTVPASTHLRRERPRSAAVRPATVPASGVYTAHLPYPPSLPPPLTSAAAPQRPMAMHASAVDGAKVHTSAVHCRQGRQRRSHTREPPLQADYAAAAATAATATTQPQWPPRAPFRYSLVAAALPTRSRASGSVASSTGRSSSVMSSASALQRRRRTWVLAELADLYAQHKSVSQRLASMDESVQAVSEPRRYGRRRCSGRPSCTDAPSQSRERAALEAAHEDIAEQILRYTAELVATEGQHDTGEESCSSDSAAATAAGAGAAAVRAALDSVEAATADLVVTASPPVVRTATGSPPLSPRSGATAATVVVARVHSSTTKVHCPVPPNAQSAPPRLLAVPAPPPVIVAVSPDALLQTSDRVCGGDAAPLHPPLQGEGSCTPCESDGQQTDDSAAASQTPNDSTSSRSHNEHSTSTARPAASVRDHSVSARRGPPATHGFHVTSASASTSSAVAAFHASSTTGLADTAAASVRTDVNSSTRTALASRHSALVAAAPAEAPALSRTNPPLGLVSETHTSALCLADPESAPLGVVLPASRGPSSTAASSPSLPPLRFSPPSPPSTARRVGTSSSAVTTPAMSCYSVPTVVLPTPGSAAAAVLPVAPYDDDSPTPKANVYFEWAAMERQRRTRPDLSHATDGGGGGRPKAAAAAAAIAVAAVAGGCNSTVTSGSLVTHTPSSGATTTTTNSSWTASRIFSCVPACPRPPMSGNRSTASSARIPLGSLNGSKRSSETSESVLIDRNNHSTPTATGTGSDGSRNAERHWRERSCTTTTADETPALGFSAVDRTSMMQRSVVSHSRAALIAASSHSHTGTLGQLTSASIGSGSGSRSGSLVADSRVSAPLEFLGSSTMTGFFANRNHPGQRAGNGSNAHRLLRSSVRQCSSSGLRNSCSRFGGTASSMVAAGFSSSMFVPRDGSGNPISAIEEEHR